MHECLHHSNMAHKWTFWIALWGFLCVGGLECAIQSEGTDNSNIACANEQHTISCGSNAKIAIISLTYGYKGESVSCTNVTGPNVTGTNVTGTCCTYNRTTDCLEVAPNEATLMELLSGRSDGITRIGDAFANTTCTSGYKSISTFNIISYQCIQDNRINEMCVPSSYRSEDGLPVYVQNRDYRSGTSILSTDTSCSVSVEVLSRSTNTHLYILHMQLFNTSNCQQSITVSSGNNVVKTFNCDPAPFNQIQSETLLGNYFLFNLTNTKTETGGKFWIGVEGASGNPPIVIVSPAVPRINCGDLTSPVNGNVETTDTNYGSVANYTCSSGYDVTLGNISRICQENGTWSGTAVVCSYNCGNLTDPINGFVTYNGTFPGNTASYGCDTGYIMDGGDQDRSCLDGTGWNGTALKCAHECGPLENPQNGLVVYNASTATYSCNSGFELHGTQTQNCVSGGGWNGSEPTCSATSNIQPSNEDDKGIGTTALLVIAIVLGVAAVALLVAIIVCYCNKKRYRKTHPEKQAQETPQDQTHESQFTKQEETKHEVDHETPKGKKKKRKRKKKHQRPTEHETMATPQEQNGSMEPESKPRHDVSIDPREPPRIELKRNEPMEKEEEQLLYSSMFPMEPPRVEKKSEPIMHPTISNATETDTHLRHRRLSDEECHDIAFHPHGELSHWTKQEKSKLGFDLETTNEKKKKTKKKRRVHESMETTQDQMGKEYEDPHDNSLSPKQSPGIIQSLKDSYVRQLELEASTSHLTTWKENETNAHFQHKLQKDHIHTYTDHTLHGPRAIDAISEFSDHHCHDFVYHPHEALSHWTREEESKLGLPHETTETKKKKKKKKKKKAKHQEQNLFD